MNKLKLLATVGLVFGAPVSFGSVAHAQDALVVSSCSGFTMPLGPGAPLVLNQQGQLCGSGASITQPTSGPVDPGTATATQATIAGCEYNSTPVVMTNTQQSGIRCDNHAAVTVRQVDANGVPIDPTTATPVYPVGGATAAYGIQATTSTALEATGCKVFKASAGNVYDIGVTNQSGATGYLFLFNLAAEPANGTVTPNRPPIIVPASGGFASWSVGGAPASYYPTGITACLSSTGGFTLTKVTSQAIFTARYQ